MSTITKITDVPQMDMAEAFAIIGHTYNVQKNNAVIKYSTAEYNTENGTLRQFDLTKNNLEAFTDILGLPQLYYQREYFEYVWIQEQPDITLVLYTGDSGTVCEVRSELTYDEFRNDDNLGLNIIALINDLIRQIQNHPTSRLNT